MRHYTVEESKAAMKAAIVRLFNGRRMCRPTTGGSGNFGTPEEYNLAGDIIAGRKSWRDALAVVGRWRREDDITKRPGGYVMPRDILGQIVDSADAGVDWEVAG